MLSHIPKESMRLRAYFILLATFITFDTMHAGNVIHVPAQYAAIQTAIDSSSNGDTVLVERGTYFENLNMNGKNIVLTSEFIYTANPQDVQQTIINGSHPQKPDTASCVLIVSHEDSTCILEGFTLTGGKGTVWTDLHGAGIFREGGGVLTQWGEAIIRDNIITGNSASNSQGVSSSGGGGIRCSDGDPSILNNIIMLNNGRYGAGIVLNYCGAVIRNNIIFRNTGGQEYGGSGIWIYSGGPSPKLIENNTITQNSSALDGGGIRSDATSGTYRNNILWRNTATTAPEFSLVTGGATFTYNDVQGGRPGTGEINIDPQFAASGGYLSAGSPCIDAGDPVHTSDVADPSNAGNALFPSFGTTTADMGAFGGLGTMLSIMPAFHYGLSLPPNAATAQSGFATPQSVTLRWQDSDTLSDGSKAAGYKILIYRDSAIVATVDSGVGMFLDGGLIAHQRYTYYFRTFDAADTSTIDSLSAYSGGTGVPAAPSQVSEKDSSAGVVVTWINPSLETDGSTLPNLTRIYIFRNGAMYDSVSESTSDTGTAQRYYDDAAGFHYYQLEAVINSGGSVSSALSDSTLGYGGLVDSLHTSFESGLGSFYRTGAWDTTSHIAFDGKVSITDSPVGNSAVGSSTFVLTPPIVLGLHEQMSYQNIAIVNPTDVAFTEISKDGRKTWTTIASANSTTSPKWAGLIADSAAWVRQYYDLTNYGGDTVTIRFRLTIRSASPADGWYVDSLSIAPKPALSVPLAVAQGWNLVSLPVYSDTPEVEKIFPSAASSAFTFNAGYRKADKLSTASGYWLKFDAAQSVPFSGQPARTDTAFVHGSWNLVGSASFAVDSSAIVCVPNGIIQSSFYSYNGSYQPSIVLEPGVGYWVKCSAPGMLILVSSGGKQSK
jgi:hypothetical protein